MTGVTSIPEMVEALRRCPSVAGIAEYGSASYRDEGIEGDYDVVVITDMRVGDVESLHFHVGQTPVDLNIRTFEQINGMGRAEGFESILLEARVIHDPSGRVGEALRGLRDRHSSQAAPAMKPGRFAGMRHGARHTFDKLRGSRELPVTLKRHLLHQCVYWLLPQYFEVRGLQYQGEKHGLAFLRENEPELYRSFEAFYATTEAGEQARLARSMAEAVLLPVGGLWADGEVLTFGDPEEGAGVFGVLFGGGGGFEEGRGEGGVSTDGG
ncbi:MAG: hypothetical protein JXQ73_09415 [Phycisphaerae bacterium]|nr:hypothetical protein [Phycisphaerae bacterium]